ncbi:MAG: N-acetylmuramoyl-L-alanine amidase [Chloroflexi bacterium]|nr:N-acetylmuramoyl-L-alanine amidase [Chloroflexota bacterium]
MRGEVSITRRQFLKWTALGVAGVAGAGLWRPMLGGGNAAEADPSVRAVGWLLTAPEFAETASGVWASPAKQLPFLFNAVGAAWPPDVNEPPQMQVRASADGLVWTAWRALHPAHTGDGTAPSTDPLLIEGRYLQVLTQGIPPAQLRITAIDGSAGPTADEMQTVALPAPPNPAIGLMAITPPALSFRGSWGANESYRFKNGEEIWPPEYAPPQKIIVHHSDTANDQTDSAAAVRSIYYYHAVIQGWGDIGYNYLVDARGRVYVGRYGGRNSQGWPVLGGHALKYNNGSIGIVLLGTFNEATPPAPMMQALVSLVSAQAVQYGVHPSASSYFIDKTLQNICGHRDCIQTACPGDGMYALLPSLRTQALANLPPLGVAFNRNQIPTTLSPGQIVNASVTLRNSGSRAWPRGGTTPFRVGVRWQKAGALPAPTESPFETRTDLPKDIAPGQDVTVQVRLMAPPAPGKYEVRVDMIQDTVQWFSDTPGNEPLVAPITVVLPNMKYRQALPVVGRQGSFQAEALRQNRP